MVHILMATYNGEKYLPEQLASIERQKNCDWKLHVRDDNSVDGTWGLLSDFALRYPERVELVRNPENRGAKQNFAALLGGVREPGDYVFCDQDDIWEPEKLCRLQKKLRQSETLEQALSPVLVYSDAVVIDENGEIIAASFQRRTGVCLPHKRVMESLLLCNFVQGAAAMWNDSLQKLLCEYPMPEEALMHDWWAALVAAGHGRIVYLPEKLLRYRQHTDNVVGGFDRREWHRALRRKLVSRNIRHLVQSNHRLQEQRREQAEAYWRLYGDRRVGRYLEIHHKRPKIYRAYLGIKEGYIFLSKWYSVKYYLI